MKKYLFAVLLGVTLSTSAWASEIQVMPEMIDFGYVRVGMTISRTAMIQNLTDQTLSLNITQELNGNAFMVSANGCDSIFPRGTCDIFVSYHPFMPGFDTGTIVIRTANDEQELSLSGNGTQY